MSFNAWHPRAVTGRTTPAGKRAAHIVPSAGEAVAKPMEWREIGAELRDSVLVQKHLFSSPARMDRVVSGANARPEFSRILIDYASGRLSYRAARRRLLWHFPRLLPRLARIALGGDRPMP